VNGFQIFLEFTLIGLGTGAMFSLTAVGSVTIYRGSKTLNLAAGGIALWAALLYFKLVNDGWSTWPTFAMIVLLGAAFGVVVYLVVIRPIRHRTYITRMVATLGIYGLLSGLAATAFANAPLDAESEIPLDAWRIPGVDVTVGEDRVILLAIAIGVTAALALWSSHSRLALGTRAISEHERAAQALGASPNLLGALTWGLGCALTAAAGILVAPTIGLSDSSLSSITIFALAAALLGKFESYWLALGGGIIIGVLQGLSTHYAAVWLPANYATGWDQAVPFVFIMILLVARRDRASNRLPPVDAPPVAGARFRPLPIAIVLAVVVVFLSVTSTQWLDASILSLAFAMLGLSLVVLIGYANQISLAQMTIAGLGALVAAKASIIAGVPFEFLPIVGAVAGGIAGFIVGLPALRVRGVNLAVATLAMSLAVTVVVFGNTTLTGGAQGLVPRPEEFFGLNANPATHPRAYALITLGWLVVATCAVFVVRRSTLGRRLLAMRTDERAAESLGVNVARAKLAAFVISSAIAGAAGVLLAFNSSTVTFDSFGFNDSINLVIVAVVAGVGSITGGLTAGTMVLGGLSYALIAQLNLSFINNNYTALFGAGLVVTVLMHPNGLSWRDRMRRDQTSVASGGASTRLPASLDVEDVRVSFGGVRSVDGAGISVEPGTVLGLVGPNGAGKSTLLDAISGFVRTDEGRITLGDSLIGSFPSYRRARLGVGRVFQGVNLFEDMTIAQNLRIAAENAGQSGGSLPSVCDEAVRRFNLEPQLDSLPGELSLAQRKFAGVARSLAANPSVLLLDEPGAGLSVTDMKVLGTELRNLAQSAGLPVVVVDHDMGLIMSACDRIVVLQMGRVIAEGSPSDVAANAEVRAAYLGDDDQVSDDAPKLTVPIA